LSQQLHDDVGQTLSLLGINLNLVLTRTSAVLPDTVRTRIVDSIGLVEAATEKTRNVMSSLRPPVLDDYGLPAAFTWYAELFTLRTGIELEVEAAAGMVRPSPMIESCLFRIAQEALTNVAKHSFATRVNLLLDADENTLRMEIIDNGVGFNPRLRREQNKWGLNDMADRAAAIGGALIIESDRDRGTRVITEVQL